MGVLLLTKVSPLCFGWIATLFRQRIHYLIKIYNAVLLSYSNLQDMFILISSNYIAMQEKYLFLLMCAHIFRGKQCKLPRISLIAICTALNAGDVFRKSHLTLLLHSCTETDCFKWRANISKLKQLQHLQQGK